MNRKKVRQVIPGDIDCAAEPSASVTDIAAYLGVREACETDWYLRDDSTWKMSGKPICKTSRQFCVKLLAQSRGSKLCVSQRWRLQSMSFLHSLARKNCEAPAGIS